MLHFYMSKGMKFLIYLMDIMFNFNFVVIIIKGIPLMKILVKLNIMIQNNIEIYDREGINLLITNNKYKLLSNCEINHNETNKIILNIENINYNNSIFYVFE